MLGRRREPLSRSQRHHAAAARGARGDGGGARELARQPVERARGRAARARGGRGGARRGGAPLVGAAPEEIVFTSGGTEGDNLAVRGLRGAAARAARRQPAPARRDSSPLEHPAVLGRARALERDGFAVTLRAGRRRRARSTPEALRGGAAPGHRAGDAGRRQPRARQRLPHRGAGRDGARGGRALPHRRGRRRRASSPLDVRGARRRRGDALGAQARRAEGRGRALPAARASTLDAAARRRAPGARAPAGHRERRRHRRLRRGGAARARGAAAPARRARLGAARAARARGCSRSRARACTAIRRAARCPGRSTSGSRARPGSWSRSASTSRASASRPAPPAPRARSSRRRCCARSGLPRDRGGRGGAHSPRARQRPRRRSIAPLPTLRARALVDARRGGRRASAVAAPGGRRAARADRRRAVGRRRFVDGGGAAGRGGRTRSSA